jgi:hypothetical protein
VVGDGEGEVIICAGSGVGNVPGCAGWGFGGVGIVVVDCCESVRLVCESTGGGDVRSHPEGGVGVSYVGGN